jgi:hypothetical protein
VEGKVFVDATEASNEVIFEGADGTFCGIAAMDAGRYQLEVNIFFRHVILEDLGTFIVEALELGAKASGT